jgi:predicted metal-dependent enzyme (double-stranded beta helix superfamily)
MFDVDQLIADCRSALAETQPIMAVREILDEVMSAPGKIEAALPATRAEIVPLHASPELSILKVVWAPGMRFRPHNHLMWAAIGLYGGQEDNEFYRREGGGLVRSGGRDLRVGDVALLGDDTIHAVANPSREFTGAIHVYGGDITAGTGRSEWDETTSEELAYDFERTRQYFEAANLEPRIR